MSILLSIVLAGWLGVSTSPRAQAPNVVTRESTVTGTVASIARSTRVVTFRKQQNVLESIYVDPAVKAFDDLKVGDVVTIRYVESVVVRVRRDAKLSEPRDTTDEARKAGGDSVIHQVKAVVTIEDIDSQRLFVTYRTQDGVRARTAVNDKQLLEGVRAGDRIEITLTRERAVEITRKTQLLISLDAFGPVLFDLSHNLIVAHARLRSSARQ